MGIVRDLVGQEIKSMGFTMAHSVWSRNVNGIRQLLQVERSSWGPDYEIGVGIVLDEVAPGRVVKRAASCDLYTVASQLAPAELRMRFIEALKEDSGMGPDLRLGEIRSVLLGFVDTFFLHYSDRDSILDFAKMPRDQRPTRAVLASWALLEYVGIKRRGPSDPDFDPRWGP